MPGHVRMQRLCPKSYVAMRVTVKVREERANRHRRCACGGFSRPGAGGPAGAGTAEGHMVCWALETGAGAGPRGLTSPGWRLSETGSLHRCGGISRHLAVGPLGVWVGTKPKMSQGHGIS